jgi:hypothetical protein
MSAGAVGALVLPGRSPDPDVARVPEPPPAAPPGRPAIALQAAALVEAASRLAALQEHVRRGPPESAGSPQRAPPPPAPPDPERVRRDALREHEERLRAHDREPIDAAWSARATPLIAQSLSTVAKANRFQLIEVGCRLTTCTAVLEWDSFQDAVQSFQSVAAAPLGVRCAQQLTLPEPQAGAASYRATALFDCEADR